METQKRPMIFTVLGIFSIVGGISNIVIAMLTVVYMPMIGRYLMFFALLPGILFIIEGVGMLKLKKWLPYLLLILFVVSVVPIIYIHFTGVEVSTIEIVGILVGGLLTGYTFHRRAIFVN